MQFLVTLPMNEFANIAIPTYFQLIQMPITAKQEFGIFMHLN
jgi:hypothetical protein